MLWCDVLAVPIGAVVFGCAVGLLMGCGYLLEKAGVWVAGHSHLLAKAGPIVGAAALSCLLLALFYGLGAMVVYEWLCRGMF